MFIGTHMLTHAHKPTESLIRRMVQGSPKTYMMDPCRGAKGGWQKSLQPPPHPSRQLRDWRSRWGGGPGALPQPVLSPLLHTLTGRTWGQGLSSPRTLGPPMIHGKKPSSPRHPGLSKLLNRRLGTFCKCRTRAQRHNLSNRVAPGTRAMIPAGPPQRRRVGEGANFC